MLSLNFGSPPQNVQKGQGSTLPRGIVSVTKRWRAVRHAQTSAQRREQIFARYFYGHFPPNETFLFRFGHFRQEVAAT